LQDAVDKLEAASASWKLRSKLENMQQIRLSFRAPPERQRWQIEEPAFRGLRLPRPCMFD